VRPLEPRLRRRTGPSPLDLLLDGLALLLDGLRCGVEM
jgi:hypothetical protein